MLEITDLTKQFFGLTAVDHVTTRFERGQVSAIIGPNGAGKTTFFNLVAGTHPPTSGRIVFNGQDVTGMRPDHVARLGIARTFQTTNLFDNATVLDNLIVGHRLRTHSGLWDVLINSRRLQAEERLCREKASEALDFVGLSHVANRIAADITQEERKRVAPTPDATAVAALAPAYRNADLGPVTVTRKGGGVTFDFRSIASPMGTRRNDGGTTSFVALDPTLLFFPLVVGTQDGKRTLTARDGQHEFVFVEG